MEQNLQSNVNCDVMLHPKGTFSQVGKLGTGFRLSKTYFTFGKKSK